MAQEPAALLIKFAAKAHALDSPAIDLPVVGKLCIDFSDDGSIDAVITQLPAQFYRAFSVRKSP